MKALNFLFLKKILAGLKRKTIFALMCFVMKIVWLILFTYNMKILKLHDLLLITDHNMSHYVYIKSFNRFMCNKRICKNKNQFCKYCLQCFSSKRVLVEPKEVCLKINSKQKILKLVINMLSNYCSKIAKKYSKNVDSVNKLIPNLGIKSKYVALYKNLQLYLLFGIKLTGIHEILKFKQSDWLKKYTDFITDKRIQAATSFDIFFKLTINNVYEKAMEKLRKVINVRLVNNAKDYKKYKSKPSFVSQKIFSKNVVCIHGIKSNLTLDKPIYVGFSILNLCKYFMYDFHYEYAKTKHDAKLLFTDTDSLVCEIKIR